MKKAKPCIAYVMHEDRRLGCPDAEYFELLRGGYSDWEFPLDILKRGLAASIGRTEAVEQPIKGNFFICGLGEEDFAELPQDLIQKFRERFWVPEAFVSMFGQMAVIKMDDGTKPE